MPGCQPGGVASQASIARPSGAVTASLRIGASAFAYSAALKAKEGTWTDANLDAYLKQPSAFAPGTKMLINVPNDENRAAIVSYLKTLK